MILLMIGGAGSLPLGGAPLPEDPVLSAIAPEECLWYGSYAGQGPASAESTNETELLFAEPQVQRFAEEIETQLMRALRRAGGGGPQQQALIETLPVVVRTLLTRPLAIYVEDVQPAPGGVAVEAAVVLSAGERRPDLEAAIARLLGLAGPRGPQIQEETLAGLTWSRPALPPQAPPVRWAWKDSYLLIAIGEQTPQRLVDRMDGSAPAWLTELRAKHDQVERELSVGRLNVAGILERLKPLVVQQEPQAWAAAERLGLTSIRDLTARSGYDAVGCVSTVHLATDGQRRGVLALLPHEPLSKHDLSLVPHDPLLAWACRIDPGDFWDDALGLITQFEPRAEDQLDRVLMEIESHLGVDVRRDVIDSLDDVWVAYLPGGDLMSSWLNSAAAVKVKDHAALDRAITKLCAAARMQMRSDDAVITESRIGDHSLYSLQFTREPVPFSPSWCVSDDWLVVGLLPQAVRAAVERREGETLAAAAGIDDALVASPAMIAYQDTPRLVQSVYPWLQMFAQMASGQLRREGVEIDPSVLPSVDVIVRHLRPSVTTWSHESDGFHMTSRGSLPGGGNSVAAAPVAVALLLPAVQAARTAARDAADMNHMKQIMLAILNYESTYGYLPRDIVAEDGTPLLSWRVAILPFIEQNAMYDQIHMDEPWDSPHNSQFHMVLPSVYASNNAPAGVGETRFLGLKGPQTIFAGDKKIQFRMITDGTSNTVCFVQADPDVAVEWMKPGDLPFDPQQPQRGLSGGPRGVLVAMCDGSVHHLAPPTDWDTLRAIATRDGGEPVNFWQDVRGR
ncbi:MAG: DUF1559 domain-containing protein [Planctomycetales bacterium]|nr:DUF1559 domain-containing protein [Planctomycetales bacterium]